MKQILYIEDTADTRDLVQFILSKEGFTVALADNAAEGLRMLKEQAYALILLDVGLPDKDGIELCREIRRADAKTPILFYTAFAELLDRDQAIAAGAQGCLRKPEDTARLGEVIGQLLANKN